MGSFIPGLLVLAVDLWCSLLGSALPEPPSLFLDFRARFATPLFIYQTALLPLLHNSKGLSYPFSSQTSHFDPSSWSPLSLTFTLTPDLRYSLLRSALPGLPVLSVDLRCSLLDSALASPPSLSLDFRARFSTHLFINHIVLLPLLHNSKGLSYPFSSQTFHFHSCLESPLSLSLLYSRQTSGTRIKSSALFVGWALLFLALRRSL